MPARTKIGRYEWLRWLTRVRFFGISLVLVVQFLATYRQSSNPVPLLSFLILVAAWYTLAVTELLFVHYLGRITWQIHFQILADLAFITALVAFSGGMDSLLPQVYALLIIVAAMVLRRWQVYFLAGLCTVAYWGAAELALRPPLAGPIAALATKPIALSVVLNGLAFFAAAYLATLLAGRLQAAGRELQEQKHVLNSLRALNDNIVRSMGGGLVTADLAGRIYLVNPAAERILERSAADLTGQQADDVFGPIPESMIGKRGELWLGCNGRQKIIGLTVVGLQVEGPLAAGRIFHFQDLTQLRRLERELRVRDRMTALGRMAAGIAHEIRNPLASLAGSVSLLARYADLDEEQQRLVAIVGRESERLNRIIGDFLGYARDHDYRMASFDLRPILEDVLSLARNSPRCFGIVIAGELGEAPIPIWGDADRLKQVFWNLCDNALKSMPNGGRLRVAAETAPQGIRLVFQDSGCGLTPGSEEEIFEPFRSGFENGTGLGLATVYAIVSAHQGKVWAESPAEGGARFVVQLPLETEVFEEPRPRAMAAGAGSTIVAAYHLSD